MHHQQTAGERNSGAHCPTFGDQTLQNSPSCQVSGPKLLPLKNGKFANVLLGQTITLGLNLRLDPTLANLDLTTIGTPVVIKAQGVPAVLHTKWR